MSPASWALLGGTFVALMAATALFGLQLNGRMAWEHWAGPVILAFLAPLGLLVSYVINGETARGLGLAAAAWLILVGAGALGFYAGSSSMRGGEVLTVLFMMGTGVTVLLVGWAAWDLDRRVRAGAAPAISSGSAAYADDQP